VPETFGSPAVVVFLDKLTVGYQGTPVLRHVSLPIMAGHCMALLLLNRLRGAATIAAGSFPGKCGPIVSAEPRQGL
jgi:hypothetical protein